MHNCIYILNNIYIYRNVYIVYIYMYMYVYVRSIDYKCIYVLIDYLLQCIYAYKRKLIHQKISEPVLVLFLWKTKLNSLIVMDLLALRFFCFFFVFSYLSFRFVNIIYFFEIIGKKRKIAFFLFHN